MAAEGGGKPAGRNGRILRGEDVFRTGPAEELIRDYTPRGISRDLRTGNCPGSGAAAEGAGNRKIRLPQGGNIVIDRCEAMTVIEKEKERQQEFIREIRDLPQRPETYYVVTFGCQMNAHDSEKIAGMLEEMGMIRAPVREEADFVIFNTCCVRENAERKALGNVTWLKEVRKTRPGLMIAVCGCMIQEPGMAEKILKQYRFIDLAFGTANLHRFPEMMYSALNSDRSVVRVEEEDVIAEGLPVRRLRQDAAYLTIMYGCDNFCSFCIVPYVRGRERSRNPEDILREAEGLLAGGVKEIMLLGQNVNSYGKGLESPMSFAGLLRELDGIGIPRIRFMTSHPKDLSDELIRSHGRKLSYSSSVSSSGSKRKR